MRWFLVFYYLAKVDHSVSCPLLMFSTPLPFLLQSPFRPLIIVRTPSRKPLPVLHPIVSFSLAFPPHTLCSFLMSCSPSGFHLLDGKLDLPRVPDRESHNSFFAFWLPFASLPQNVSTWQFRCPINDSSNRLTMMVFYAACTF